MVRGTGRQESAQVRQRKAAGRPWDGLFEGAPGRNRRTGTGAREPSEGNPGELSVIPAPERACVVSLQNVFDGPLDLLLHLVKEQELDIATVSLATVADQYFAYISGMEQLDIELAAEYLVMAATLVFLKSRSLLPPIPPEFMAEGEETPEMVEERLRQRLITYSKYRDAGEQLR